MIVMRPAAIGRIAPLSSQETSLSLPPVTAPAAQPDPSGPQVEYRVTAAPLHGEKARDAKTPTDRFALALTAELNRMAAEGWEYLRADVLPSEERSGLTGRSTVYHNLLVFRRPRR